MTQPTLTNGRWVRPTYSILASLGPKPELIEPRHPPCRLAAKSVGSNLGFSPPNGAEFAILRH